MQKILKLHYRYHNVKIAYNARLDEIQAGLLRIKLRHMAELLGNRDHIAQMYLRGINNPSVVLPRIPDGCRHTWYQFVVRVDEQEKFREHMKKQGVVTDIAWKTPSYLQPAMVEEYGYKLGDFPQTEHICNTIVSLPMMDFMEDNEIHMVINAVNRYPCH